MNGDLSDQDSRSSHDSADYLGQEDENSLDSEKALNLAMDEDQPIDATITQHNHHHSMFGKQISSKQTHSQSHSHNGNGNAARQQSLSHVSQQAFASNNIPLSIPTSTNNSSSSPLSPQQLSPTQFATAAAALATAAATSGMSVNQLITQLMAQGQQQMLLQAGLAQQLQQAAAAKVR